MNHVTLHIADDASPPDRRGKIIGSAQIDDETWHRCILDDDVTVREARDLIVEDFATTNAPLAGTLDDIREVREAVALRKSHTDAKRAREAAARAEEAARRAEEAADR